jgi:hypothetical protein
MSINNDSVLIEGALNPPIFGLDQKSRETRLFPILAALTRFHMGASAEYRRIVESMFPKWEHAACLAELPFLPVGLFKQREIKSIPDNEIFKIITSSGTTGSIPSRVHVDRITAGRQTRALTSIMGEVIGPNRRPMLVVDTDAVFTDRTAHSARAAGVIGLMTLGRKHVFLLDDSMTPIPERLNSFAEEWEGTPLLIFGFTFMIWKHLLQPFAHAGIDLSEATVIHSGGWKQLEAQRISNELFKQQLNEAFGIHHVVNFYGMAEQVGSVFVEGPNSMLHASSFADVIVRDPETWQPQPPGRPGVLQVLSSVPTSYPGHSILTEDVGVIDIVDDPNCRLGGQSFRVLGRLPKSELRGCSDTYASTLHG